MKKDPHFHFPKGLLQEEERVKHEYRGAALIDPETGKIYPLPEPPNYCQISGPIYKLGIPEKK